MSYKEELATIMSTEMGKSYAESVGEVAYAAGLQGRNTASCEIEYK
jgi:acyl-CoA reductase-like NAD-dependent aldehyde dehydrogenase